MGKPPADASFRHGNAHYGLPGPTHGRQLPLRWQRSWNSGLLSHPPNPLMPLSPKAGKDKPVRILLVDDHPVVRDGFAELINREPDLSVCATAEDRSEALQLIEKTVPQL